MNEWLTIEEVYQAYEDCCKHKKSSYGYVKYHQDFIMNNYRLYRDLNTLQYQIGVSRAFCVTRPKLREVFCATFRDRIVHHLLANKFIDIIESELTDSAFACRKGKGTHYGIKYVEAAIKRVSNNYTKETWILKCDLQGFFMSINRNLLFNIVNDVIRNKYKGDNIEQWLWLWKTVIFNAPEKNCVKTGDLNLWKNLPTNKSLFTSNGKGLPIGNLSSQLLANLLLSKLDNFILNKIGNGGYGRYVDDFILIHNDKEYLKQLIPQIKSFLKDKLGLTLHPKKIYLQNVQKGVSFIGAYLKPNRIYVNHKIINNCKETFKEYENADHFIQQINSYFGMLKHYNTKKMRWKLWKEMPKKDICCINLNKIKKLND